MTLTGLIIVPLACLIVLLPWRYNITALFVLATLDSSAVVNIGSFGLQPSYFFSLLIIGRTLAEVAILQTPLSKQILRHMLPLLMFAVVCFLAIWVGLTFFQGRIMVVSSLAGFNLDLAQPYTFQRQNLTQPFYLVLNVALVYTLAHQLSRMPSQSLIRTIDVAIISSIVFAGAIVFWEMAHFYSGLFFPDSFFHSNAGYAAAYRQVLPGGILRASGPFAEPSALAYYMAGGVFYTWYRYLGSAHAKSIGFVILCLCLLSISTSTTAILVLGFFGFIVILDMTTTLLRPGERFMISVGHLRTIALVGLAAAGVTIFLQNYWILVDDVLTQMLFEKSQTSSFAQRRGADMLALDILLQSGGIGIGLGSHKPNNLVMMLLSNTGIAGFLTFSLFAFDLLRPRFGSRGCADLKPLRWMVLGLLFVHALSNPNLNSIVLWIGFGVILGALVSLEASTPAVPRVQGRQGVAGRWSESWEKEPFVRPQTQTKGTRLLPQP